LPLLQDVVEFQRQLDYHRGNDRKLHEHREVFVLIEFRCNLNLSE
jgi:hypothetical protein